MGRLERPLLLGLLLGLLLSSAGFLIIGCRPSGCGFPLDDAWIHQTYARSLSTRGEWSMVPGEPSAGSTAPLWTLMLAAGQGLGLDPRGWTYALGIGMLLGLAITGAAWVGGEQTNSGAWALAAGLLVLFEWHLGWAAFSGMEILLLGLVSMIALRLMQRRDMKSLALGMWIGLGVWVRPDALSLLLPAVLISLLRAGRSWRKLGTTLLGLIGGLSLFLLPYMGLNWLLSGEILPTTFFAKQAEYAVLRQLPIINRLLRIGSLPLIGVVSILVPGIVLHTVESLRRREWQRLAPLLWVLAYLGLYALRLPVTYQHGRYAMPVIPLLLVLGLLGMGSWVQVHSAQFARRFVSRAWCLSVPLLALAFWGLGLRAYQTDVNIIETEMVATARWIARHTEPQALIAAHDIGALGYFGERRMVDLAGLITPEVVAIISDQQALARLINQRGAQYLMTFPGWYPELVAGQEMIFSSAGSFSPAAGGENMAVYRWR